MLTASFQPFVLVISWLLYGQLINNTSQLIVFVTSKTLINLVTNLHQVLTCHPEQSAAS